MLITITARKVTNGYEIDRPDGTKSVRDLRELRRLVGVDSLNEEWWREREKELETTGKTSFDRSIGKFEQVS